MPTVYHLLERAERVEATSAAIYAALAVQFAGNPAARATFEQLAAEEMQHASRIRLLAGRYRHDARLLSRTPGGAPSDLAERLAEAEAVLADIRAGKWSVDLATVKKRLSALEDRLSRAHAEFLSRDARPDLRTFFEQLAQQDAAHARLLLETT